MVDAAGRATIHTTSALVAAAWALLSLLAMLGVHVVDGDDPISLALFVGIGSLVPLGVTLLPRPARAPSALMRAVPTVLVLTSPAGATSLVLGLGPASGIAAGVWMMGTIVLAIVGLGRIVAVRQLERGRAAELGVGAALVSLPVGAAWLVMSRLGVDPMGVTSLIVLCTAVHFHFTSFGAVTLIVLALRRAESARGRAMLTLALASTVLAIPLVAAGWSGVPVALEVGVWTLAGAIFLYALTTLWAVVPKLGSRAAKVLLALSALAPVGSMPLALMFVEGDVDIDTMVHVHGLLNAYGVVGLGLCAHALDARAGSAGTRAPGSPLRAA